MSGELPSEPEYWGGQPFPADVWGKAPIRGKAVRVVQQILEASEELDFGPAASDVVDGLIEAGVIPDEVGELQAARERDTAS